MSMPCLTEPMLPSLASMVYATSCPAGMTRVAKLERTVRSRISFRSLLEFAPEVAFIVVVVGNMMSESIEKA